jgi:hypothetical protein
MRALRRSLVVAERPTWGSPRQVDADRRSARGREPPVIAGKIGQKRTVVTR